MKRIIPVLVFVAVLLTAAACSGGLPDFATYTSDAGQFSVSMRGTPTTTSKDIDAGSGGKVTQASAQSTPPGEAYIVLYMDFPDAMLSGYSDPNAFLADYAKTFGATATVTSTKPITLGSVPGVEVNMTSDASGGVQIIGHIYLAGKRVYVVQFNGTKSSFPQADADKFLSSFTIKS